MADFFSNIGDALTQGFTNRVNDATSIFDNPQQYAQNRINTALGATTATNAVPVSTPVAPTQMGPTVAANMGQQPSNPLNGMGAVAPTAPNSQTTPILPSNQISPATVAAPAGPAQPGPDYYQGIAQQESSNNPNIGYHYPPNAQGQQASTAFGTYGITAPAYQDVQKADPYFAGKPITSLNADDQTRAAQVYTGINAKQLQQNGIEPTEPNLRLAHFLGAGGATNYLQNDVISPAAAKANGGEGRVRHIISNIMGGTAKNVSAPETTGQQPAEQPKPFENEYNQINDGDPVNLVALSKHENGAIAQAAKAKLYDQMKDNINQNNAKQIVDAKLSQGQNPFPQGRQANTEEGSYIKAYLFARLGLNDLAAQEQEKISPTKSTMPVILGNDHYAATYNKNGDLLYAYDDAGNKVDNATFNKIATNAFGSKGLQTGQTMMKDAEGNVWSHSTQKGTNQVIWTNQSTGKAQTTAPSGLTPIGQINPVTKATIQTAATAERNMRRTNNDFVKQGLPPKYTEDDINNMKLHITNGGTAPAELTSEAPAAVPAVAGGAVANKPANVLPPDLETQAQEIYAGRQPMPSGMGANNLRNQAILNRVQAIGEEKGVPYNSQKFKQNQEMIKDFAIGKNAQSVDALKTAFNHIDELTPAIAELNNGRFPVANAIVNKFATAVGGSKATTVEQIGPIVGNEIEKTWNPRMGTAEERAHIVQQFSSARSPEQLNKAIETYKQLMMGKVKPLEDRYNQTGQTDFWTTQINDPSIKSTYDKWKAGENVRKGQPSSGVTSSGIKWKKVE